MAAACAWCDAPAEPGPTCPVCGADYAKAEAIRARGKAEPAPAGPIGAPMEPEAPPQVHPETYVGPGRILSSIPVDNPAFERQYCLIALPSMLLIALLVQVTGFLASMQRIVFGMPLHELGHAVTGWLCGFNAIPTVWKTLTPPDRGYVSSFFVLIALLAIAHYGYRKSNPAWLVAVGGVLVLQACGTFLISVERANMLITIAGDALGMILATILMALFYVGKDTQIYRGALRWGFVAIGAAAFVDMYAGWWLKDVDAIGYGLTGGEPTDSWKMIHLHGWKWAGLFKVHNTIGMACLSTLAIVYALGLRQANRWVREERAERPLERVGGPSPTGQPATRPA